MLRIVFILLASMMCLTRVVSQVKVGLNPLVIDDASLIEIESTSKGFLPSRMTSAQRDLQTSWEQGHIIYNLTDSCLQIYDGAQWDCFIDGILIDSTIYKYDGSLSEDRTLSLSGSNLTFSGTNNVTFESSGELGIGVAAPDGPLHIVETTGTPASASDGSVIIEHGDAGGASSLVFKSESDEGNDYGYIQYQDDGSGNGSSSENSLLTIGVGSDGLGANQDDIALLPSGNVGIGTTTPAAKLDVATGTVRFSAYGSGTNTGDGLSYLLGVDTDGDVIEVDATSIGSDDQQIDSLALVGTDLQIGIEDDAIGLRTLDLSSLLDHDWYIANTTDQSTSISDDIFTLGNVGIGTNQPFSKLQVSTENSEDIAFTRFDNSPSDDLDLDFISGLGTPSVPLPLSGASSGDRIAGLRFRAYVDPASVGTDLLTAFARIGEIAAETDGTYSATSSPGKLLFSTTPDGSNASIERMTIKNDGKVGIGTGLPDELLHVAGNMRLDGAFEDKDGQAGTNGQVLVSTVTGTDWVDASTIDTDTDDQSLINGGKSGNDQTINIDDGTGVTFSVADADSSVTNELQTIDALSLVGTELNISLSEDGVPNQTVDLAALQDGTGTDDQRIDSFSLDGNILNLSIENDGEAPLFVDLSTISGSFENIYNTSDSLESNRSVTMDGFELTFDGAGDGDVIIQSDGDVGIGTTSPTGDLEVRSDEDQNAFSFIQENITTGEKDVFTIEDQDVGGGGQDESSVLKVIKSGAINSGDNGFSLVELANTGTDPGANKYWISGRKNDEGAPLWGVDITDNDYWSEGGIILGVTGADGGTYSGGTFRVEADGDVGVGTTTPGARLDVQGGSVTLGEYGVGTHADTANVDYILVTNASGEVKELNTAKNTRWFYPPAVVIDASSLDTMATLDLHADYVDQFGSPLISSDGASGYVPYYQQDELEYYVTDYDTSILGNISIDADGVMTYDVISVPFDNYTVINVVFVIKDP